MVLLCDLVSSQGLAHVERMSHRFNVICAGIFQLIDEIDDSGQIAHVGWDFVLGNLKAGETGDILDLASRQGHAVLLGRQRVGQASNNTTLLARSRPR